MAKKKEDKEKNNKRNILWFENETMNGLFQDMEKWQVENEKRFLATGIQKDDGKFCCIAFTNPSEVMIVGANGRHKVDVNSWGCLKISEGHSD